MKGLKDKADLLSPEGGEVTHPREALPAKTDLAGIRGVQSAQHLEQGCLSASAGPSDGDEVSFLNPQINPAESVNPAILVGASDSDRLREARGVRDLHAE